MCRDVERSASHGVARRELEAQRKVPPRAARALSVRSRAARALSGGLLQYGDRNRTRRLRVLLFVFILLS